MKNFGFDLAHPNLKLVDATPVGKKKSIFADVLYQDFAVSFEKLTEAISEELSAEHYSRIVIDPVTMLKLTIKDELQYRRAFMTFLKVIYSYDSTVVFTSELNENDIEKYLVSGVIELRVLEQRGKPLRGIKIKSVSPCFKFGVLEGGR
ncbi:KaiC/GvpD/RAD55 family RecA-like ATPase [Thermococcus stetteri]|nr:KaiC/GvpD/RAD55 family RecA-like ATPase [Thermococcus stetteri]